MYIFFHDFSLIYFPASHSVDYRTGRYRMNEGLVTWKVEGKDPSTKVVDGRNFLATHPGASL